MMKGSKPSPLMVLACMKLTKAFGSISSNLGPKLRGFDLINNDADHLPLFTSITATGVDDGRAMIHLFMDVILNLFVMESLMISTMTKVSAFT
jgi:hypothetical protein